MKTALLDVNVLTALHWPTHEHSGAAHRWAAERSAARWATCPLTQLGFLRMISNPMVTGDSLSPVEALAVLDASRRQPTHEFWSDDIDVWRALKNLEPKLQGYKQFTDAYLLALAVKRRGILATFDRGVAQLAAGLFESALEIVPTR